MIAILRKLVSIFGCLVYTLPKDYRPAGWAFLHGLTNTTLDSKRSVPQEILPTIALAVLNAIDYYKPPESYEAAVATLDYHKEVVLVQMNNYPLYKGITMPGYTSHPHYYVMGAFAAKPIGGGYWLIEDRYDWHFPAAWRVPDSVATRIPEWILNKLAVYYDDGWYLEEVGVLDRLTVPYWHRSIIKLSDYLTSASLHYLRSEEDYDEEDWLI